MKYVSISTTLLRALVSMASAHVEDVESGLDDHTYDAAANKDLPEKQAAVAQAGKILQGADAMATDADPTKAFLESLLEEFPGFLHDDDVNGGDLVEFIDEQLPRLLARSSAPAAKNHVPVRHWLRYQQPTAVDAALHGIAITDHRKESGQVYLDVCALEGDLNEMICAIAEINGNPLVNAVDGMEQPVPCLHVHFDEDNLAFSVFRVRDRLLVRPEADMKVTSETLDSPTGLTTAYWIG